VLRGAILRFDRYSAYLYGVIFFGFIARLYYIDKITVRGDEIAYLYDSYLITKGEVPLVDYHARTPIYLYYVSLFLRVFGNSIVAARFSSLFVSTLTMYFLFILVKKLFDRRIALVTTAIFAFSPFSIKYGIMLVPEVLLTLMFVLALIIIVDALPEKNTLPFIIAGIMMGLSVYIRRTAGLSIIIVPISIISYYYINQKVQKKDIFSIKRVMLNRSAIFIISFIIGFFPLFYLLSLGTSWEYMVASVSVSSAGKGMTLYKVPDYITFVKWLSYRTFFLIALFFIFLLRLLKIPVKNRLTYYYLSLILAYLLFHHIFPYKGEEFTRLTVFILFLFAAIPLPMYSRITDNKYSRFFYFTSIGFLTVYILGRNIDHYQSHTAEFIGIAILLIALNVFQEKMHFIFYQIRTIIDGIITKVSSLASKSVGDVKKVDERGKTVDRFGPTSIDLSRLINLRNGWFFFPMVNFFLVFCTVYLLILENSIYLEQERFLMNVVYFSSLSLILYLMKFQERVKLLWGDFVIIIWFFTVLIFYSSYGQFLDFYYYEILIPLSIGGGVAFIRLNDSIPRHERKAIHTLVSVLVISVVVSNSFLQNMNEQSARYELPSPENIEKVSEYLKTITEPGDIIFTASLAVVVEADLRIPMDISHAFYYHSPDFYISHDLLGYPTLDELKDYLINQKIQYAVVDYATELDYFEKNDGFKDFFFSHYTLIKTIGVINIFQLNEEYLS